MAAGKTLEARLNLIMEAWGADKILKDFKKIELGVKDIAEVSSGLGLPKGGISTQAKMDMLKQKAMAEKMNSAVVKSTASASQKVMEQKARDLKADNQMYASKAKQVQKESDGWIAAARKVEAQRERVAVKTMKRKSLISKVNEREGIKQQAQSKKQLEKEIKGWDVAARKVNKQKNIDAVKEMKRKGKIRKQQEKEDKKIAKSKEKAGKANKRFSMEFLGIMFAGMALQRMFGGMFKSLIANYRELGKKSNPLNVALVRLESNFTFLKYSIMEASSGALSYLINGLASFAIMLAKMDPNVLKLVAGGIIALAATGALLMVGGQFMLGIEAFLGVMDRIANAKIPSMLGKIGTGLAGLGVAATIAGTIYLTWDLLTKQDDATSRFLSSLGIMGLSTAAGALLGFMIGGPVGAAIGAGIGLIAGVSIALSASIADTVSEDGATWEDYKKALKKNMKWLITGAAFMSMGPTGIMIMSYGLIKTVFDVSTELDSKQKGIIEGSSGKLLGIQEDIISQANLKIDAAFAKDETVLDRARTLKEVFDSMSNMDMGEGQTLSNLFGGDYDAFTLQVTQMETQIQAIQDRQLANATKLTIVKGVEQDKQQKKATGVIDSVATHQTLSIANF
ncbi:MAG: hypothetical protein ACTSYA_09360, partial [Candidatus Kariarchaeaceae archaeon]